MPGSLLCEVRQVPLLQVAEHLGVSYTPQPVGHRLQACHGLPALERDVGVQVSQGFLVQGRHQVDLGRLGAHLRVPRAALEFPDEIPGGRLALPHLGHPQGQVEHVALQVIPDLLHHSVPRRVAPWATSSLLRSQHSRGLQDGV